MAYPKVKFDYRDYSCSEAYPELALIQQSEMTDVIRWRLFYIHTMLILPLMEWAEEMPFLTSAFRNPQLNEAVGSRSRQHMRGEAVDILWKADNVRVFKAFKFIEEEMKHQTGWCALYIDLENECFDQIHWALPLGHDMEPRKNPRRFWYRFGGKFHTVPPVEIYNWKGI